MSGNDKPWWKQTVLFKGGGWHPLTGRLRRGIQPEDVEEQYAWEYTEEHILRLKELGMTLLVGQFDRGLGETDQEEHEELARRQAELCHKHGIRHGVYIANTVYYESMLKDHPDCEDWVVKTHDGRKVHYGGLQTFRWVGCFNSPGWRNHVKEKVRKAIVVVKTDLLHFDNLAVWPEPDSCHCDHCQAAFRAWLERRYPTAEAQKRKFGYTGFETFRAPNFYLRFIPPWDVDFFNDPLHQEWILFRQWTVTDYIGAMSGFAHELKPEIALDSNGQTVTGANWAVIHGVDSDAQLTHVDILCDENPDLRPDDEPGAIYPSTRRMRGAKFARERGMPLFTGFKDAESLAANITLNGHCGINMHWGYAEPGKAPLNEPQPGVMELLRHVRRHERLYADTRSAARIAVWREKLSLAFISTTTHLSACVMEQLLFDSQVPFTIVMNSTVDSGDLGRFRLIVLPNVQFIGPDQIDRLTEYVRGGGALLITEQSGTYTDEPRSRVKPAFAHLFAEGLESSKAVTEEAGGFDPNTQFASRNSAGRAALARFGDGRVAYLPRIDYVHGPHAFKSGYNKNYDGIDSRYWKHPYNAREILDAVEWLDPTCRDIRVIGGKELRSEVIHADGVPAVTMMRCGELDGPRNMVLRVRCARPGAPKLYVPRSERPIDLEWTSRGDAHETILPAIERHAMVTLEGMEGW